MIIASDIHADRGKPMLLDCVYHALKSDKHRTLIIAGDLTCWAREEEYERVACRLMALIDESINVVLAAGNHDMSSSLLVTRLPKAGGYRRYSALMDIVERQPIVVARLNEFDALFCVGRDVFTPPGAPTPNRTRAPGSRSRSSGWRGSASPPPG